LAEPVRRIWAGERDQEALTAELNTQDTAMIVRVLKLLNVLPTDAADETV
jgi:hypothetical protein